MMMRMARMMMVIMVMAKRMMAMRMIKWKGEDSQPGRSGSLRIRSNRLSVQLPFIWSRAITIQGISYLKVGLNIR